MLYGKHASGMAEISTASVVLGGKLSGIRNPGAEPSPYDSGRQTDRH